MRISKRKPEEWYRGASQSTTRGTEQCVQIERISKTIVFIIVVIGSVLATLSKGAETGLALAPTGPTSGQPETIVLQPTGIRQEEVGEGFRSTVHTVSLELGVAPGMETLGSRQAHSLALANLNYGRMVFGVMGEDHRYRGN